MTSNAAGKATQIDRADFDHPVGFAVHGSLNEDYRVVLWDALLACKGKMPEKAESIYWFNIFSEKKFTVDHNFTNLHKIVEGLVQSVELKPGDKHILRYGFLVNPVGNKSNQPFHTDYGMTDSTIFVPLTAVTERNATQYITRRPYKTPLQKVLDGMSAQELLESEGLESIEVRQMVAKPFSVLHMLPGTMHRGVPNTDNFDRIVFYVAIDDYYHDPIEHGTYESGQAVIAPGVV